jgi:WD40-like Beta Propeller Repeat
MTKGEHGLMRVRWVPFATLCATLVLLGSCGGTSLNPTPVITALYPETIAATLIGPPTCTSNPGLNLNLGGNNFITTSVAYWNGSQRATTFDQTTGQLTVKILACDIATPGVAYISVVNPPPGGGPTLNAATFQVTQPNNPAPSISSLAPASVAAGTSPPPLVTINGAPAASGSNSPAFISSSQVAINGNVRAATFVSSTEMQVQLVTSDIANTGTLSISVTNPSPGGGTSSAQFSVTDPPNPADFPQVISVSASAGAANGASSSPAMSADGRYVAFYSEATNLVASGASGNIFVRDTCVGATNCTPHTIAVDLAPDGYAPNARARTRLALSADARYLAFSSTATNLVADSNTPDPSSRTSNIFVRDLCFGSSATSGCSPHTVQISEGSDGEPANDESSMPSLSSDGRFVAYESRATNLVAGVADHNSRLYVTDLCSGTTPTQCSSRTFLASSADAVVDMFAVANSISGDGRFVVYSGWPSAAGNRLHAQIFLRDTCLGADAPVGCVPSTKMVSVGEDGSEGDSTSSAPSVSADGRFVVFGSSARNLAPEGSSTTGLKSFLRDMCLGSSAPKTCVPSTTVIPLASVATELSGQSFAPSITGSGRYISFGALLTASADAISHLLVRDTCIGARDSACSPQTNLVSINRSGEPTNKHSYSYAAISADGRFIAFSSDATNLASPTSGLGDVFLTLMPSSQH